MLRDVVDEKRLMMHYDQKIFSDWVETPRVALAAPSIEPASADRPGLTNPSPFTSAPQIDLIPGYPPSPERSKP